MLTPEQIDALPVGSVIYDRDGDKLERRDQGWAYSSQRATESWTFAESPGGWEPYSLVPPIDPADPLYNPFRDARR